MRTVLGIDVAAGRWVAVRLEDGRLAGDDLDRELAALLARHPDAGVVGIDVPIGLPALGEVRPCDLQARERLGARWASVFPAPPAELLHIASHAEATARSVRATGRGISRQAHGLRHAILEAAPLAAAQDRLHEVHPELAFTRAAGGTPVAASKKTWDGQHARRALLEQVGVVLPRRLDRAGAVPVDDVLDAAICARTADLIASGDGRRLPADAAPGAPGVIWS